VNMKIIGAVSLVLLLGVPGFAASPVGTISSSSPFLLRGASVPVAGVPSWPVAAGDEFATDVGPATLNLRDGSRVTLGKNSRAKLEAEGDGVALRLLSGAMLVVTSPKSTLRVFRMDKVVSVKPGVESTVFTTPAAPGPAIFHAADVTGLPYLSSWHR
jgi:FecR-like protein